MTLQFDVEEFIRPLVSALYESSDEDMDIDTASTTVVNQSLDEDSDIEVIACYRETQIYPPQLAAGRAMTFDITDCGDDQPHPQYRASGSIGSTFDPSDRLVDWIVGSPFANLCRGRSEPSYGKWWPNRPNSLFANVAFFS